MRIKQDSNSGLWVLNCIGRGVFIYFMPLYCVPDVIQSDDDLSRPFVMCGECVAVQRLSGKRTRGIIHTMEHSRNAWVRMNSI